MKKERLGVLNVVSFVLSLFVVVVMLVELFVKLPKEIVAMLTMIDHSICAFFFVEFCIRFYKAESKLRFMRWGWLDLLSCIPMIEPFRFMEGVRYLRILRIVRAYRSMKHVIGYLSGHSKSGAFTTLILASFLITMFSSMAVLEVEMKDEESNIKTAEDALWWGAVTITTVGYGDRFPVTTVGRCIAVFLMFCGVGTFGTFAALVGSWFIVEKEVLTSKLLVKYIKWYQIYLYEKSEGEGVDSMADVLEQHTPEELIEMWSHQEKSINL